MQLHSRVSREAMEQVEQYADLHDCPKWEAVDRLIKIGAGGTDVATQVDAMDAKLQRVLEELQAPGIGSEISEDGIAADGALSAKIDYDNLQWRHSVEISPEEAAFSDPSVVSQTPRSRVPVVRGILLDRDTTRVTHGELVTLIRDVFNCTLPTAEGYAETGEHKSWYPHPGWELTRNEALWSRLKDEMVEAGVPERALELKDGMQDYCSERVQLDEERGERYVLPVEEEYLVDDALFNAQIRQIVSNMEHQIREHTSSGKYKLLLEWVFHYGQQHGDLAQSEIDDVRERIRDAGAELPGRNWWE